MHFSSTTHYQFNSLDAYAEYERLIPAGGHVVQVQAEIGFRSLPQSAKPTRLNSPCTLTSKAGRSMTDFCKQGPRRNKHDQGSIAVHLHIYGIYCTCISYKTSYTY
jgi:hypothetical protein